MYCTVIKTSDSKKKTTGVKMMKIKDDILHSESAVIWLKDRYLSKSAQKFIELFGEGDEKD